MPDFSPGALVKCRGREWVVSLLSEDLIHLHPLVGQESEKLAIFKLLLHLEDLEPAFFSRPGLEDLGPLSRARLFADAARLSLRYGVSGLQCASRLNFEPRPYQLVPLIMALRLDPVRLLIADDVGIGKTIEAALIVKELVERGEIRRFTVLCPPYLVDQWAFELREKFGFPAEIISSRNMARLEKKTPGDTTVFRYFPYLVASIDYLKSERWRSIFLKDAPELIIVDEVHTCARPPGGSGREQHLRYQLVKSLADDPSRHLILLTATPHSGIEESFRSLLGLLHPDFENLNLEDLNKDERRRERERLARHFIQRTRAHVKEWLGSKTPFPQRESEDLSYTLSPAYRRLFEEVRHFAQELVETVKDESIPYRRRRLRFWAALALLRSVMSSPAAAVAAFEARIKRKMSSEQEKAPGEEQKEDVSLTPSESPEEELISPLVYDPLTKELADDTNPTSVIEHQLESEEEPFKRQEIKQLAAFLEDAQRLSYTEDIKFQKVASKVRALLNEGFSPVIYCRYIATADYVAQGLLKELGKDFENFSVSSVTGLLSEDERRLKVEELSQFKHRVLVATDCLSEGINLQEHFNAIIHYDLPWNPNRLEQREGRVDRFGQPHPVVKTYLVYGQDNPVDGAVLEVLLRKARTIHKDLGILVPLPQDHARVMEALVESLFLKGKAPVQKSLFEEPAISRVTDLWDEAVKREKLTRTIFAQRAIKLQDEVAQELAEVAACLGTQKDVERFVREAIATLDGEIRPLKDGSYKIYLETLPFEVRSRAGLDQSPLKVSFHFPPPEGATYLNRNHPLVEALSAYILGRTLTPKSDRKPASRASIIRSSEVISRTVIYLLRARYRARDKFLEELLVFSPGLGEEEARNLLYSARSSGEVLPEHKERAFHRALEEFEGLGAKLEEDLYKRAQAIEEKINRLRRVGERRFKVKFVPPADLLGLYVFLPKPSG